MLYFCKIAETTLTMIAIKSTSTNMFIMVKIIYSYTSNFKKELHVSSKSKMVSEKIFINVFLKRGEKTLGASFNSP